MKGIGNDEIIRLAIERGGKVIKVNGGAIGMSKGNTREHRDRKRPKYNNIRTEYGGRTYASIAEAQRARKLDELLETSEIRHWEPQPKFHLGCPENVYIADFVVWHHDGTTHVEDVKGAESPKFRRDKRLWSRYGPCNLHIIKRNHLAEIIEPDFGIPCEGENGHNE